MFRKMRLGQFQVNIYGGHSRRGGYVVLDHAQTYKMELINHYTHRRAEAAVQIDGKEVGTWRVPAGQTVRIERPVDKAKKFTFYLDGTNESRKAGITEGHSENGRITVTFVAEKQNTPNILFATPTATSRGISLESDSDDSETGFGLSGECDEEEEMSFCSGGTGLSGHSDQTFRTVSALDKDTSTTTIIHLRLVGDDIQPLKPLSNAVPPPVPTHS